MKVCGFWVRGMGVRYVGANGRRPQAFARENYCAIIVVSSINPTPTGKTCTCARKMLPAHSAHDLHQSPPIPRSNGPSSCQKIAFLKVFRFISAKKNESRQLRAIFPNIEKTGITKKSFGCSQSWGHPSKSWYLYFPVIYVYMYTYIYTCMQYDN